MASRRDKKNYDKGYKAAIAEGKAREAIDEANSSKLKESYDKGYHRGNQDGYRNGRDIQYSLDCYHKDVPGFLK